MSALSNCAFEARIALSNEPVSLYAVTCGRIQKDSEQTPQALAVYGLPPMHATALPGRHDSERRKSEKQHVTEEKQVSAESPFCAP